jgi:hypothetical protein
VVVVWGLPRAACYVAAKDGKDGTVKTKVILVASSLLLALGGLAALFMPQEVLSHFGVVPTAPLPLLVQIGGALYLGAAAMNWTARGSPLGGIYNRPVGMANLVHFFIGAAALAKALFNGGISAEGWIIFVVYAVFGVAFALVVFGSPVKPVD